MKVRIGIIGLIAVVAFLFPLPLSSEERAHIVEKGDTIFSIARFFNVERDELMRVNGITDPARLRIGQKLTIPPEPAVSAGQGQGPGVRAGVEDKPENTGYYKVVRGDTFYGIARRFGLSMNEILAANSLTPGYILKQGDVLILPGAANQEPAQVIAETPLPPAPGGTAQEAAISVRWPVTVRELSYLAGANTGVVITGDRAEPVKSLTSGTVISAGPYRGYGRVAIVEAADGYIYVYGGCESLTVREGDKVGPGMEIGKLGIDTLTQKPQLFFRVYLNNAPVDPAKAPRL